MFVYFLFTHRYKGKSFRALVEICKTTAEVNEYLRNMCIKLECCPNLISQQFIEDECPLHCAMLTKTKYSKCCFRRYSQGLVLQVEYCRYCPPHLLVKSLKHGSQQLKTIEVNRNNQMEMS